MVNKDFRKLSELRGWDKNPRAIKKQDFERLKKQIQELGQYKPLIITPDGEVLGGNMRLEAYKALGIDDVWVSVVKPKSDAEKVKYALSDNDRAGYYVEEELAELVSQYELDLNLDDFRIDLGSGMSLRELLNQFAPDDVVEDEPPAVEDVAVSVTGEVYQLGNHRLMCGDATKIEDVEKLMNGKKADMVFTDPPYNYAQITGAGIFKEAVKKLGQDIKEISKFDPTEFLNLLPIVFNEGTMNAFIFCNKDLVHKYLNFGVEAGYSYNILTWHKKSFIPLSSSHHFPDTEYLIYLRKNNIFNSGLPTDCYRKYFVLNNEKHEDHPTIKPLEIITTEIKVASNKDGVIVDLFGGSGSTLIACEQTNRTCYMMELDPHYCDVIRKRYANFIGKGDKWQEITPTVTVK